MKYSKTMRNFFLFCVIIVFMGFAWRLTSFQQKEPSLSDRGSLRSCKGKKVCELSLPHSKETLHAKIAETNKERERGLSGVSTLSKQEAMLFIFPREGKYAFWMKGMLIPIDILWLDNQGKVVYFKQHATPDEYPQLYQNRNPARYVLELAPGVIEEYQLALGDTFEPVREEK